MHIPLLHVRLLRFPVGQTNLREPSPSFCRLVNSRALHILLESPHPNSLLCATLPSFALQEYALIEAARAASEGTRRLVTESIVDIDKEDVNTRQWGQS